MRLPMLATALALTVPSMGRPVHRRILYSMHDLNMTPERSYSKCARVVGDVLGRFHPHGDASVYMALVRMAQPFSLGLMLVDGQGNFGCR